MKIKKCAWFTLLLTIFGFGLIKNSKANNPIIIENHKKTFANN